MASAYIDEYNTVKIWLSKNTPGLVTALALLISISLGACSAREGIDIDDPEISSAYERHQEALQAYEEVAAIGHAWSTTADLIRLSYLSLEEDEPEMSLRYSAQAEKEAELAYKQYNQQYEYADVLGTPLRCAVFFAELDCPGYAAYAQTQEVQEDGVTTDSTFTGESDTYEVVRGDSLWRISARDNIYGDPFRWPLIFKTNASKIKDADLIFPRQKFNIFRGFDPSEINRAVLHARTRGAWIVGERESSDTDYLELQ